MCIEKKHGHELTPINIQWPQSSINNNKINLKFINNRVLGNKFQF